MDSAPKGGAAELGACQLLIQSMAAARQRAPMKDRAVFSYRVATAMHDAWDLG